MSKTYVVKAGSQGVALGAADATPDGEAAAPVTPNADVDGEKCVVAYRM